MHLTYNSEALIRKMGLRRWREGDKWRKQHQHIYTIVCKWTAEGKYRTASSVWPSVMTQMLGWEQGREAPQGGGICVITADSRYCTAETNTTV